MSEYCFIIIASPNHNKHVLEYKKTIVEFYFERKDNLYIIFSVLRSDDDSR
jgi:hypothetical protein